MTHHILHLDSSGQYENSITRKTTALVVDSIKTQSLENEIKYRDLAQHLPLIDEAWMQANFAPTNEQATQHRNTLVLSNELITELNLANLLVIGVPVYNFNIPAALKAWIDLIVRAKVTFQYTENGPEGMVTPKKVYLVYASGGTPMESDIDFATPYLKHVLGFIGLTDITLINSKTFEASEFQQKLVVT